MFAIKFQKILGIRQDAHIILVIEETTGYRTRIKNVGVFVSDREQNDCMIKDENMSEYLTSFMDWLDKSLDVDKGFCKIGYEEWLRSENKR